MVLSRRCAIHSSRSSNYIRVVLEDSLGRANPRFVASRTSTATKRDWQVVESVPVHGISRAISPRHGYLCSEASRRHPAVAPVATDHIKEAARAARTVPIPHRLAPSEQVLSMCFLRIWNNCVQTWKPSSTRGVTRTPFSDYLLTVNHFGVGSITHFLAVDPGCGVW